MACQSSRFSRLFGWRYLRRALAPALPLALWACNSHPLQQPAPVPQQETDILVAVNPPRTLDILFMVDNSPSMESKQLALGKAFPEMIDELKKLPGGLPDVHIAVVSSDLGAGTATNLSNCNRGGNFGGDLGALQAKSGCGLNEDAKWLAYSPEGPQQNYTGDISSVFACMASLGTSGCGYEHQLKSSAVALQRTLSDAPADQIYNGFLRDEAYLALVLISDEDDCSADWDSDMFSQEIETETTSLRCASRGHMCSGHSLEYPTSQPFSDSLANCTAKETDTPLMPVSKIIEAVRGVKPRPTEQIVVAGIFGWPTDGDAADAQYRIDVDPNPLAGQKGDKLDYLPICEISDSDPAKNLGKIYAGLRLKAFVDAFGKDNGLMFPLCANDFKTPMQKIGEKLRTTMDNTCIDYPFIDTLRAEGVQPECSVVDRIPNGKTYTETVIPPCNGENPGEGNACWELVADEAKCTKADHHLKINVRRGADGNEKPKVGTMASMKCLTCAQADGKCDPQYKD